MSSSPEAEPSSSPLSAAELQDGAVSTEEAPHATSAPVAPGDEEATSIAPVIIENSSSGIAAPVNASEAPVDEALLAQLVESFGLGDSHARSCLRLSGAETVEAAFEVFFFCDYLWSWPNSFDFFNI